jgi:hypothetical protein
LHKALIKSLLHRLGIVWALLPISLM